MQILKVRNFLTHNEIKDPKISIPESPKEDFFDVQGVYEGKVTSTQQWIDVKSDFARFIKGKLDEMPIRHLSTFFPRTSEDLKFSKMNIDGIQILRSEKPYDVHSDWIVTDNQVQLVDPTKNIPTYTVVIPLIKGDYKTIVFDQGAKYNNFSDYKKLNPKLERYCADYAWKKNCSHCDPSDQEYLTIKDIFHWECGTLFAFSRKLFHCSANFSELPKKAIVLWLSVAYPTFPSD